MSDLSTSFSRRSRPLAARRRSVFGMLADMIALRRQRQDLSQLDARTLKDIGVTREAAQDEARRPSWDAPSHWMR
ncbi:hypothetical protein TRM7557_03197 [Tritonibacter multivorans]|uniref:YjiS-like domain-containing protein n=1 Tax=Tritonibacter multivorans TaxID=928856 RepID=A0A0N7M0P5_9RHOB|nr:DUF1127 domain-containing protein [Tritonibacter multivorans]MDA7420741.1 DUF1127 domain-containing protein [Tritonibacter multivorans]CUH81041.1 hypothetical protein TRM7557_03197 [Tritonibacter multivorans]SFC26344.1 protein of unknown function [Tritonibacter multivorans]